MIKIQIDYENKDNLAFGPPEKILEQGKNISKEDLLYILNTALEVTEDSDTIIPAGFFLEKGTEEERKWIRFQVDYDDSSWIGDFRPGFLKCSKPDSFEDGYDVSYKEISVALKDVILFIKDEMGLNEEAHHLHKDEEIEYKYVFYDSDNKNKIEAGEEKTNDRAFPLRFEGTMAESWKIISDD